jgi:regulator of sigma E protease
VNVLVAIAGLAVLILLHEAGHFFVARAVGMNPRKFYLGFPPAIVRVRRKGIEYGIGAIPAGGYVKIPGMHRPAPSDLDVQFGPAFQEEPRIFPKVARVKNALERGDFSGAREGLPALADAVDEADLSPTVARAARRGLTELGDALSPDAYWRQSTWKRIAVIFAGPGANILIALVLVAAAYMLGVPGNATPVVKKVEVGKPAAMMGLRPGDEIVAVNGSQTYTFDDVRQSIASSHGQPLTVIVLRNGRNVTLKSERPVKVGGRYILGFYPRTQNERYGVGGALRRSLDDNWRTTRLTLTALPRLVERSGRKQVSGPVGIVQVSSEAVGFSFPVFLEILGVLSISLALLNLLPLLPLDGGHILFSIVEGLRRRAVGREIYERVSVVGIALFLILLFIGLSNDVNRLFHGG